MLVIKNCKIVSEDRDRVVTVLIKDGVIDRVDDSSFDCSGCRVVDADGLYLLPSIVDLNVRILDDVFNTANLKRLYSEIKRAGVGDFMLSPRFMPLVENQIFIELLKSELNRNYPQILLSIKALKSDTELNDISILSSYGIKVIQENSSINGNLIRRIMQYAQMRDSIFFLFCQNLDLNDNGVMNEGEVSFKLGVPGISKIGEISEVAKMVQMSIYYRVKTHFQSLSTIDSIELINMAKDSFSKISSEISIHHLVLDDTSCDGFNTYAKLNPPLRDTKEKDALIEALKSGKIDTITALHSPKSISFKDVAFSEAKFGIDSIGDFLSLCYTFLVKEGIISLWELTKYISQNPADILEINDIGLVKEGYRANLILFDPDSSRVVESPHSPYHGRLLYGDIRGYIYNGVLES